MDDIEQTRRLARGDDAALERAVATPPRPPQPAPAPGNRGAHLAGAIVFAYLVFLFVFLGYLVAKSWFTGTDVAGEIAEVLKIGLLPLVTLAIGYYFGSQR